MANSYRSLRLRYSDKLRLGGSDISIHWISGPSRLGPSMEAWKAVILKLKIFWACLKKNWKAAALAVWSIVVWFVSRRNSSAAIAAMEANKESYEAQIKSLKKEHKIEREKIEQLNLKYKQTLATIEEKYNKKEKELSQREKKRVKEIVKQAKESPDEINKKIEDLFGFTSDS